MYLLLDKKDRALMPLYFLFKCEDITSFDQYKKLEKNAAKMHKAAHKLAEKRAKGISKNLVYHHTPFS